ncbi:MAG: LacI family transcriptional regulator [Herminiimonas sp.]|nr:LacI family transcriptional regulator [Herminiimonas sp.]
MIKKNLFRLFSVVAATAAVTLSVSPLSYAQSYPSGPISFVVPYPPGGASDVIARLIGQKLSERYGQPVVIENKPGANGNIALELVARAKNDGHTILMGNVGPNAINAGLYKQLRFDPINSFAPITMASSVPVLLVVNPNLPVKNVPELISYIKANAGKINFATGGVGSATHLTAELFKSMAGVDITMIPYKGDAPALNDVLSGKDVAITFATSIAATPYVKSGKVRLIGVASTQRAQAFPDTPTVAETLPGFESTSWGGVLAPAGTPAPVIASLNTEIVKILRMPEIKAKISGMGAEVVDSTPDEFKTFIRDEIAKWSKVIKQSGASAE